MIEYVLIMMICGMVTATYTIFTAQDRSLWFYIKTVLFCFFCSPILPFITFYGLPTALKTTLKD
jgi:hypothetical protein